MSEAVPPRNQARRYGGIPVERRQADRRRRFLEAGLEVFGRDGYQDSPVQRVCREAGLSNRQFYEEFSSREDLLVAVYDMIQAGAQTAVAEALVSAGDESADATAGRVMAEYAKAIGTDPRRAQIIFVESVGVSKVVERHRVALRSSWAQTLEAAIRERLGDAAHPLGGYSFASLAFIHTVEGIVHEWSQADPRPPLSDLSDTFTRILLGLFTA